LSSIETLPLIDVVSAPNASPNIVRLANTEMTMVIESLEEFIDPVSLSPND
jgi:hypothetical protein